MEQTRKTQHGSILLLSVYPRAHSLSRSGQALLARFFGGAISPLGLLLSALVPTIIATIAFRLL